ncbi:hypothetical protein PybrP1_012658 [[Pythium] brassicae (nom. inval.)]|nr:hypothetical protein PybrP1_012658 [[Pythium] brassicae (nom. inval.)]
MSSGFGFKGREGRCYQFWKDVEQCSKSSEYTGQCGKQLSRMNAIVAQKEKQAAAAAHGGGHDDDGHGH